MPGDITHWLGRLQEGDPLAAQRLWESYFERLVTLARRKLEGIPRRAADEEDVALSAFDSFCRAAERRRFPRLNDRDDLWRLLLTITCRKAADLVEHEGRAQRDWRRSQPLDPWPGAEGAADLAGREPDPAFAAEVADRCRRLLGMLGSGSLLGIALRKMEGFTNDEIAAEQGCAVATVERRLRLIRKRWEQELDGPTTENAR